MEPDEVEFIGENGHVEIVPSFNGSKLHLICGTVGPFVAGIPLSVPIWLALHLKRRQKCRLVPPSWMNVDLLEDVKENEKNSKLFTKMPSEHYMVETKLLLSVASEDIPRSDEIRTIIKDIWDMRMSKLRTSMDALIKSGGGYGRLDHLTLMEINAAKPLLPYAMDNLFRLQKNAQNTLTSSLSNTSASFLNTSSFNTQ